MSTTAGLWVVAGVQYEFPQTREEAAMSDESTNDESTNIWNYRDDLLHDREIVGFDVEAIDGHIGKIDAHSFEADDSHIVVDTGFWIFDKRRLIPAGAVTGVDHDNQTVIISLTKDQVRDAPDFIPETWDDPSYVGDRRADYNEYYRPHGW
jgi:hypothetical protein